MKINRTATFPGLQQFTPVGAGKSRPNVLQKSHPQQANRPTGQRSNNPTDKRSNTLQDNENGAFGQDKYQKIALDFSEKFIYLLTYFGRMDIAGYAHHCIEGPVRKILKLGLTDHILE